MYTRVQPGFFFAEGLNNIIFIYTTFISIYFTLSTFGGGGEG